MQLVGLHDRGCRIYGFRVTNQMRRTYGDVPEATEYGASGVAALLIECAEHHTVYERSPKDGGGFDYFLIPATEAPADPADDNFLAAATARLEVSGILIGTQADMDRRVEEKLQRLRRKPDPLPAYVIVVVFGCLLGKLVRL